MRTFAILRRNVRKLVVKLVGLLWPPNFLVVVRNARDVSRRDARRLEPELSTPWLQLSAERGLRWLCNSQDVVGSGGVGSYDFSGWSRGYPEVTGYIIPTMWDYGRLLRDDGLCARARRMADWLLEIQQPQGGWEGGAQGDGLPPLVFNTAQVIRGLLRTYDETGEERYLDAGKRAADWIVSVQDPDGSWTTQNHRGLKRVYDTYVAAPLARVAVAVGSDAYLESARRNCEFALAHQRDNGWFDLCDNSAEFVDSPVTHTICYTADGLLETGEILSEDRFTEAGARAVSALADRVDSSGYLAGRFDDDWRPTVRWVCLTGSAQLGIALMRLPGSKSDAQRLLVAERLAGFLGHVQQLNSVGKSRSGAIAGSYPIWGPYAPLRFPCWATKYYLDLLFLLLQARRPASAI